MQWIPYDQKPILSTYCPRRECMSSGKVFLDSRFMKSYLISTAWIVLGAGIFFVFVNVWVLGIFLLSLGVISLGFGISGRLLKVDYYPVNRIMTLALTSILLIFAAISMRVLMAPPRDIYWLIYLLVTISLWLYTWMALILSTKKQERGTGLD
jgi:hypothetical protein